MFLTSIPRFFKIAGRAYAVESLFGKITREISAFYSSGEKSIKRECLEISIREILIEISRHSLLTGVEC